MKLLSGWARAFALAPCLRRISVISTPHFPGKSTAKCRAVRPPMLGEYSTPFESRRGSFEGETEIGYNHEKKPYCRNPQECIKCAKCSLWNHTVVMCSRLPAVAIFGSAPNRRSNLKSSRSPLLAARAIGGIGHDRWFGSAPCCSSRRIVSSGFRTLKGKRSKTRARVLWRKRDLTIMLPLPSFLKPL